MTTDLLSIISIRASAGAMLMIRITISNQPSSYHCPVQHDTDSSPRIATYISQLSESALNRRQAIT